jgi:GrpB-like predicted nucleotidyltransferase (UPF0157 family)
VIEIIPYQSRWPGEFRQIASVLRGGLGELALRIDHIGSTAVPGLAAKDVIDIQVTVAALDDQVAQAVQALGYSPRIGIRQDHRPPGWQGPESDWEKLLFIEAPGRRRTHIHVRAAGRPNQRYPLLFRDFLRAHPDSAAAYAELKRRLAANLSDPGTYPEVKDPAVDLIYFAAEDWAATTGWQPAPPDA